MSRFGVKQSLTKYGLLPRLQAGLSVNIRLCNRSCSTPTNFWCYFKRSIIAVRNIIDVLIYHCGHVRHGEFYHVNYTDITNTKRIDRHKYKRYNMGIKFMESWSGVGSYHICYKSITPICIITQFGQKSVVRFQFGSYSSHRVVIWQEALHLPVYKYVDDNGSVTMKTVFEIGRCDEDPEMDLAFIMFTSYQIKGKPLRNHIWSPPAI